VKERKEEGGKERERDGGRGVFFFLERDASGRDGSRSWPRSQKLKVSQFETISGSILLYSSLVTQ